MKKSMIAAVIIIVALGALILAVTKYSAPAPGHGQNLITGLDDDFFTNFNLDQAADSIKSGRPTAPANPGNTAGKLPVWNFRGAEILQAQKAETDIQESIINKYAVRFQALKQVANERLAVLADTGLQEYKRDQAAGTFNKLEFADKYYTAMSFLQENLDKTFYKELDNMNSELEKAGLSSQVSEEIKSEYNDSKEQFQQEIMRMVGKGL